MINRVNMNKLPSGKIKDLRGRRRGLVKIEKFIFLHEKYGAIWYCIYQSGRGALISTRRLNGKDFTGRKHLPPIERACRSLGSQYKYRAKEIFDRKFDLTPYQFRQLTNQNCYYCGQEPDQEMVNRNSGEKAIYIYNGLDRLDNEKGYTIDNVVPACGDCNQMKSDRNLEEFKHHVTKIANRFES